ncbi:MAG: hypothetical protein JWN62_162 [Acidimicrobiales bacterium]|nr:hypothetical protein [Acidimicrobiales bacterium]
MLRLVPDADERDRMSNEVAAWLRHIVDVIAERDWLVAPALIATSISDDAISDICIDDVEDALATIAPSQRATGRAATTALRRALPPFCESLLREIVARSGIEPAER